jgi:Tol biopolymer transport system component
MKIKNIVIIALLAVSSFFCTKTQTRPQGSVLQTDQSPAVVNQPDRIPSTTVLPRPDEGRLPVPDENTLPRFNSNNVMILLPKDKMVNIINQKGEVVKSYKSSGLLLSASWSSESSRAVFLTQSEGKRIISIVDLNGKFNLQMESDNISAPTISKTGKFLSYTSINQDDFRLHFVDIETRQNIIVFKAPKSELQDQNILLRAQPSISSDEKYIAFSFHREDNFSIYVYDIENRITRRLSPQSSNDIDPIFSPDARFVLYLTKGEEDTQLVSMRIDGRERRRLTFIPGLKRSISYSPDGKQIAFVTQYKGANRIYVMDTSGDGLIQLRAMREKIMGVKFYDNNKLIFQTAKGIFTVLTGSRSVNRLFEGNFSYIAIPE